MKDKNYNPVELEAYTQWLTTQGLAPRSILAYRVRVKHFLRYKQGVSGATFEYQSETLSVQANKYIDFLTNDGAPAASLNAAAVALESYGRFRGLFLRLNRQTVTKTQKMLTPHEQQKFSEAALAFGGTKAQAIGLLIYNTGMSVTRLSELNMSDYDTNRGAVRKDQGWMNLDPLTSAALNEWISQRALCSDPTQNALFVNKAGRRMSPPGVEYFIRRVAQKARVDVSPTALKQTFRAGRLSPISQQIATLPQNSEMGLSH